jgi:signal transduction histidine kinase
VTLQDVPIHEDASPRGGESEGRIALEDVGGALATCDMQGRITACSPSGLALLSRMSAAFAALPAEVPPELWVMILRSPVGDAVTWRPSEAGHLSLGCTRYRLGRDQWLLVMSEIGQKQTLLAQRLHQQRLEAVGRLVATAVHDLRAPLASIVFNSGVLASRVRELSPERVSEAVDDIRASAARLRTSIDNMLDYVRIGPPVPCDTSIKETLARMQSLLRPLLRAGSHRLVDATSPEADRVVGNPIAVEQIFVNLVINSIEASRGPITVRLTSSMEGALLRVLVEDDGPGIAPEHRLLVFDPFFTTKTDGTGIGLSAAREAARATGGDVKLVRWTEGASFAVLLPASVAGAGLP